MVVVDGSSVAVNGVFVGRDKPGRVGGRVDVTKRGATSVAGSGAILTQDETIKLASRMDIQNFSMH